MKLKKVINIFGAPGSGKSTLAATLFSIMKKKGISVELVTEYAKQLVFENRMNVLDEDQLYIFAKQHRKIFILKDTVEYIITDSPFVQGYMYLSDNSIYDKYMFRNIIVDTHNKYPSLNILLIRDGNIKYDQTGRIQNEKESNEICDNMYNFLENLGIDFIGYVTGTNDESILAEL